MNKWSNLPNARHIDWVIQSVKDNPREWNAAWYAERGAAYNAAYDAAHDAAYDAAVDEVRDAIWNEVAMWLVARDAAWGAILSLIAYDDSAKYLSMTYEELKVWAILSGEPASILLLPMVKARELIEVKYEQVG